MLLYESGMDSNVKIKKMSSCVRRRNRFFEHDAHLLRGPFISTHGIFMGLDMASSILLRKSTFSLSLSKNRIQISLAGTLIHIHHDSVWYMTSNSFPPPSLLAKAISTCQKMSWNVTNERILLCVLKAIAEHFIVKTKAKFPWRLLLFLRRQTVSGSLSVHPLFWKKDLKSTQRSNVWPFRIVYNPLSLRIRRGWSLLSIELFRAGFKSDYL